MEKINWAGLIKLPKNDVELVGNGRNIAKSRNKPDSFYADSEKSDNQKVSNNNGQKDSSRLSRLSRPKEQGKVTNEENLRTLDGDSTEKSRAANLHPIAVCLLISVARKMQCSEEELLYEMVKLEDFEPAEQIRIWTGYAIKNGLNPLGIIYPFARSRGKGFDCMSCQHIDMKTAHQPGSRRLYHWSCKKNHNILESYRGLERVLIAPKECTDYKNPV